MRMDHHQSLIRFRVLLVGVALAAASVQIAVAQSRFAVRPRPPIYWAHPIAPILSAPFGIFRPHFRSFVIGSGLQGIWWPHCALLDDWGCSSVPLFVPLYTYPLENIQRPQLALKDGTAYSVVDYWLVNNQLHFVTREEGGTKSLERVIDFNQLDVQKTVDLDTQRGFRFVLRNKPIQEYLNDRLKMPAPATPSTAP